MRISAREASESSGKRGKQLGGPEKHRTPSRRSNAVRPLRTFHQPCEDHSTFLATGTHSPTISPRVQREEPVDSKQSLRFRGPRAESVFRPQGRAAGLARVSHLIALPVYSAEKALQSTANPRNEQYEDSDEDAS